MSSTPRSISVGECGKNEYTPGTAEIEQRLVAHAKKLGTVSANHYLRSLRSPASVRRSLDGSTIRIEGRIDIDTAKSVGVLLAGDVRARNLEVNSQGGYALPAIDIAKAVRERGMALVINGYCMSACANYLLPSTREVIWKDGLVGLHGGVDACAKSVAGIDAVRTWGPLPYLDLLRAAQAERNLSAEQKLPAQLLTLSQQPDRGAHDGQPREWMVIPPGRLHELGIQSVKVESTALFDQVVGSTRDSVIGAFHLWQEPLTEPGLQRPH